MRIATFFGRVPEKRRLHFTNSISDFLCVDARLGGGIKAATSGAYIGRPLRAAKCN